MRRLLDEAIYYATMPIRLFGRSRGFRWAIAASLIVAAAFIAAQWALNRFLPIDSAARLAVAKLPPLPPLQPVSRASIVTAPVAIAIGAIGRSLDASTPRNFSGTNSNPVSSLLAQANVGLTVTRGPMSVTGRANELSVNTPIDGTLQITGQIAAQIGNLTGTLTGLLDSAVGKAVGNLTNQVLDQHGEVRGSVIVRARPTLAANWRLDPHLTPQVALSETAITLAGIQISISAEAKPMIDRAVNAQVTALQARLRDDPAIERAARKQWALMCRAIPVGGGKTGLPQLWLEIRPVRAAAAAQPEIDDRNLTLVLGVQAETRIVAREPRPVCPFPATMDLVPRLERGLIRVVAPIDLPFGALNTLLEGQLKGRRFPDDKNAPLEVEVRAASIAAAGDRLLISLRVKAIEKKSWFNFGAEATVQIWGKPALDPKIQVLRLTDLSLAVESEAAYGLLGAAARAGMPYLQQALADNAVIDLTPFVADARAKIDVALSDFRRDSGGVRVDAGLHELRLTGIAFDSNILRVIAEADGAAKVVVSELPGL